MARQVITIDGVEVSVETGTGSVTKVEHDAAKRNAEVFIRADHLKDPIRGWLDTHDADLLAKLNKAQTELGGRVAYRIETSRSADVDRTLPWAQVPNRSRFRRLVALADQNHLGDLIPNKVAATVGAPAESSSSTAPAAPGSPQTAGAPSPDPAPPGATQAPAAGAGERVCIGCGEPLAGRPVKRVAGGRYVHTDTPCLEAPFEDPGRSVAGIGEGPQTGFDDAQAERARAVAAAHAADAGIDPATAPGWLTKAGEEATAARAAHRSPDDVRAELGTFRCEVCTVDVTGDRAEHEATPQHMGKARQLEQAAALAARRQAQVADASTFDDNAAPVKPPGVPLPAPGGHGPRVMEGRPWEKYNSDGSLNMGSFAQQAATSCVTWAQRLVIERVRALAGDTGEQAHISPDQVRSLARTLLAAADRIQAATRDDGHVDRMDNSHSRARSALAAALHVYPVPWGAEPEVKGRWVDDVAAWGAMLINMAAELG